LIQTFVASIALQSGAALSWTILIDWEITSRSCVEGRHHVCVFSAQACTWRACVQINFIVVGTVLHSTFVDDEQMWIGALHNRFSCLLLCKGENNRGFYGLLGWLSQFWHSKSCNRGFPWTAVICFLWWAWESTSTKAKRIEREKTTVVFMVNNCQRELLWANVCYFAKKIIFPLSVGSGPRAARATGLVFGP
jgi:hypothetical protein